MRYLILMQASENKSNSNASSFAVPIQKDHSNAATVLDDKFMAMVLDALLVDPSSRHIVPLWKSLERRREGSNRMRHKL